MLFAKENWECCFCVPYVSIEELTLCFPILVHVDCLGQLWMILATDKFAPGIYLLPSTINYESHRIDSKEELTRQCFLRAVSLFHFCSCGKSFLVKTDHMTSMSKVKNSSYLSESLSEMAYLIFQKLGRRNGHHVWPNQDVNFTRISCTFPIIRPKNLEMVCWCTCAWFI